MWRLQFDLYEVIVAKGGKILARRSPFELKLNETLAVADLGEGSGRPDPPPLILGKTKRKIAEGRKADRKSKKHSPSSHL